ncbi:FAD-dependent oxidoreductase [uncultured Roseibium sp.]|uniref:FAD-dependent oxidoreductase n=1 Tax=uncultured Roseibium sp. TaxID=1936171 RepID=UPI00321693F2
MLLCQKIASDMCDWLIAIGVDVRENTRVVSLDETSGSVRLENGDELTADRVVVTAGAWVLGLLPDLAASLTHLPYGGRLSDTAGGSQTPLGKGSGHSGCGRQGRRLRAAAGGRHRPEGRCGGATNT